MGHYSGRSPAMRYLAIFLAFLACANCRSEPREPTEEEKWDSPVLKDDVRFLKYMMIYNRNYETIEEYNRRRDIFYENLEEIFEHNKKYRNGESTFTMGVNQFADGTKPAMGFNPNAGHGKPNAGHGKPSKPNKKPIKSVGLRAAAARPG